MVSLDNFFFVPNLCQIILLLFIFNLPNIFSQDSSPSNPTIAQCTSTLISLIPCTPFVQGTVPSPGSLCCGNLKQIYSQEPHCLCLLLNGTTFSSLPINRTLAMQLPALCNLQVNANISTCLVNQVQRPATAPRPHVSSGTKNNSTVIASPAFSVPPTPVMMGFGFRSNEAINLNIMKSLVDVITVAILLFILVT
ncbi:non-specific lipid transfer protein-like 1 [Vigna unguiculata]|uniref:non-specific lipid transfer protein-like 1 n=1 Tax=Vigna unguiculata TaxID=3917 RepID=UPI001016003E|nr:non-specific lipid transfer protein-like 1 [Vigna unguiculata]